MSKKIESIKSISQLHRGLGIPEPKHPLISVIDVSKISMPPEMFNVPISSDFYTVSMKDGSCGMQYGRNHFDFEEGVLTFKAPNQIVTVSSEAEGANGWMLIFHPDLIRNFPLGSTIDNYTYFSYEVHEALHLSKREEELLTDIVSRIEYEYGERTDGHSQGLFVAHLELLLNYCLRFYERQFHTRKNQNLDVLSKVESLLKDYYNSGKQLESGTPSVQYLGEGVNLSANYLSDLLKKETGKNAKEHINHFVVEKAKTKLLSNTGHVSEIAYELGFNYPHYFSRMFKQHTGMSPKEFRDTVVH